MSHPGIIVIWNDIVPDQRQNFLDWHSREHIPERVSIPGFLRGQRWFNADASPQYLTVYHTTGAEVLTSAAYLERLNQPTAWTRQSVAAFRNTARAAGELVWQSSGASGAVALTARFDIDSEQAAQWARRWSGGALDELAHRSGVARVMIALTTPSASRLQTAERAVRSGDQREPSLTILVEGYDNPAVLREAYQAMALQDTDLAQANIDLYSLQVDLHKHDLTALSNSPGDKA
jgi:hypothetical protein